MSYALTFPVPATGSLDQYIQSVNRMPMLSEQQEVDLARRVPLSGLDAWSSYHLGLDHMFRFNQADNGQAAAFSQRKKFGMHGVALFVRDLIFKHGLPGSLRARTRQRL